ncbi:MAG: hypothetical protein WC087_02430 [Candidatus Paceibacterota bacterium]
MSVKTVEETAFESLMDSTAQDEILTKYETMLGKKNAGKLHQFFSPTRIPGALTKKQAMICVRLLPLRKEHTERKLKKKPGLTNILDPRSIESDDILERRLNPDFSLDSLFVTLQLPRELICDGSPISKFKFYLGITKLLYRAVWKD